MKENCTTLYPNEHVGKLVSRYANDRSIELPSQLEDYHAHILATHPRSNYMISTLEGKYLTWLAKTLGVGRVLEIGVFAGFSVMVWADAVGPNGRVTGLEVSPEYAQMTQTALEDYGFKNTELVVGDALKSLPQLQPSEPYDVVFIDANKGAYPEYLSAILKLSEPGSSNRLLRKGGLIIADNVLRSGLVVERSDKNPAAQTVPKQTENWNEEDVDKLELYNDMANCNPRLEAFIMPLFDGLSLARLLD